MTLYRLFIDETGNHDLDHVENQNERFLALTGVIIEQNHYKDIITPGFDTLKTLFFKSPSTIFHRKDIINHRPPFDVLLDKSIEIQFNKLLLNLLEIWDFHVVTVVIDKKEHRDKYSIWRYHPYHYCLEVMLERYVMFLCDGKTAGDVLVESRGGKEDTKLKDSFRRHYDNGTDYVSSSKFQDHLTSRELKLKPKTANIAGLQLADLLAHPSRRDVLLSYKLINDDRDIFGGEICKILRKNKYLRSRSGKIQGYGMKLLP